MLCNKLHMVFYPLPAQGLLQWLYLRHLMISEMENPNLVLEGLGLWTQASLDPRNHIHIFLSKENQCYQLVHTEVQRYAKNVL